MLLDNPMIPERFYSIKRRRGQFCIHVRSEIVSLLQHPSVVSLPPSLYPKQVQALLISVKILWNFMDTPQPSCNPGFTRDLVRRLVNRNKQQT